MENNFEGDPYLKISNSLLGSIVNSKDLLTYEGKVFMVILFKTIGFQKEKDWLTWRQIKNYTGINHKQAIYRAIKKLKDNRIIIKEGKYFKVNQNFKEWLTLDNENIEKIKEFYQPKKLRNSVTKDNKKGNKYVTQSNKKETNMLPKGNKYVTRKETNMLPPSTDKTITDKTYTDNNKINEIFSYWNKKEIIIHRKLDPATESKIKAKLKDYTREEILEAINNYAFILADPETYWFNFKWTLREFLQRGFEKFKDWEVASDNYLIKERKDKLK